MNMSVIFMGRPLLKVEIKQPVKAYGIAFQQILMIICSSGLDQSRKKKTWWRSPHAFTDGSLDTHIGIFNKGVKLVGMQLFLQSLLHIRRKRDAASDDLSLLCDFPIVIWTLLKMVPFKFAEVRLRCALLLPESLNAGRSCHLST